MNHMKITQDLVILYLKAMNFVVFFSKIGI